MSLVGAPALQWGLAGGLLLARPPSQCLCARPLHQHYPRGVCELRGLQPLATASADHLAQGWSRPSGGP